jgi:hypothetical protein
VVYVSELTLTLYLITLLTMEFYRMNHRDLLGSAWWTNMQYYELTWSTINYLRKADDAFFLVYS